MQTSTPQASSVPFPLKTTLRGVEPSEELTERIAQHALKLARHQITIDRCLVTVECPAPSQRSDRRYGVKIELRLAGADVLVTGGKQHTTHEVVWTALREAFETAERHLDRREERSRDRRRERGLRRDETS